MAKANLNCMVEVLNNVGTPWERWNLYTEEKVSEAEARRLRDEIAESIPGGAERVRAVKLVPL